MYRETQDRSEEHSHRSPFRPLPLVTYCLSPHAVEVIFSVSQRSHFTLWREFSGFLAIRSSASPRPHHMNIPALCDPDGLIADPVSNTGKGMQPNPLAGLIQRTGQFTGMFNGDGVVPIADDPFEPDVGEVRRRADVVSSGNHRDADHLIWVGESGAVYELRPFREAGQDDLGLQGLIGGYPVEDLRQTVILLSSIFLACGDRIWDGSPTAYWSLRPLGASGRSFSMRAYSLVSSWIILRRPAGLSREISRLRASMKSARRSRPRDSAAAKAGSLPVIGSSSQKPLITRIPAPRSNLGSMRATNRSP